MFIFSLIVSMHSFCFTQVLQYIYFTAHELRMWLFHYSPIVLNGILPDLFYQHHLLLVEGLYLLLVDSVTRENVTQSTRLLRHYCFLFSSFYGKCQGWWAIFRKPTLVLFTAYMLFLCRRTKYVLKCAWSASPSGSCC